MINTTTNVIWTGPRLLVPVTLEGLVVTEQNNATTFSIQSLQLGEYSQYGNISPGLFNTTLMPAPGVYLNWALPDGMTHGLQDKDTGQVLYPYLPNRWLVVRFSGSAQVPAKGWVIESDWQGTTSNAQGTAQPQIILSDGSMPFIGKSFDAATWSETRQNEPLILTAVGNSDPLFAAYSGNNSLVYSFCDPLTDAGVNNAGPLEMSYMVCGWYSNPQYDVLYNNPPAPQNSCGRAKGWTTEQDWLDLMTQLQWSVGSEAILNNTDLENAMQAAQNWLTAQGITPPAGLPGTLAAQTLCHGVLISLQWTGLQNQPPSNVPIYNTNPTTAPYVAAGNAATDCLAAFMQWQLNYNNPNNTGNDGNVEIMLEAFSNKMLPQPGGLINTPELMNAIYQNWYGRMPGGTVWIVQSPQKDTSQTNVPAPQLPDNLAQQLAALNVLQASADADYRQLITLQKELYASWLKSNIYTVLSPMFPPAGVSQADITEDLTQALQYVQAMQTQYAADQTAVAAAVALLEASLIVAGGFTLLNKPAPDFHTPGDPVIMVNNIHRSYKRGSDIIYSQDDDFLFVRFTGQFINSLQVNTGNGNVTVPGLDIAPPFTWSNSFPTEINALLAEACLLDMNYATPIAIKAGVSSPSPSLITTIQSQQTLIWNQQTDVNGLYTAALDQRTLEKISGFNPGDNLFHVPSKIGVWQWLQPWNPLYLEWEITYYPAADPALSQWQFNGADYTWNGGTTIPPQSAGSGVVYKGRSILTPKEVTTMQARLLEFINSYPGGLPSQYTSLQDVITGMGNWDVLSQTLTGFTLQLIQWDIEQFGYQATDAIYGPAIGDEGHGMPVPDSADQFFPVRAGFVNIYQLWVVDDFGQVYDINPAQSVGGPPSPITPIPAIGVEPGNYVITEQLPAYFQLPPRIVQPSRLNFNFVSANNDSVLSSMVAVTTPVCGWVVPNHPDNSVMVYDNTGILLGELMLMGATGNQHAQWVTAPLGGTEAALIQNTHLKGFVQGILGTTTDEGTTPWSGQALTNFMATIDETLWSVDPMGERDNQSISILAGRPIALLRASLQLEIYGNPANNLAWADTKHKSTGGIETYQFPVQVGNLGLGQDGVMGYYTSDNYATFNSVHQGEVTKPASPAYVVNNYTVLQPSTPATPVTPTYITLLLDPRGAIHCTSGILPMLKTVLPEMYVGNVLDNMLIEFATGPLLMDTQVWSLPLPAGAGLKWSWLQPSWQNNAVAWSEVPGLVSSNPAAQLPVIAPFIKEGRLKLAGALGSELMIFFFQPSLNSVVMNLPYTAPLNTVVQLSWSSQGAVSATLTIGSGNPVNVDTTSAAYNYTVATTQTLTLLVTDSAGATQSAKITISVG